MPDSTFTRSIGCRGCWPSNHCWRGKFLCRTYVLGYLIGMQEIEGIRKDYIAKYGEPSPPSEFYDRLLSVGSIPPALVRESLFARKAEEVAAKGREEKE